MSKNSVLDLLFINKAFQFQGDRIDKSYHNSSRYMGLLEMGSRMQESSELKGKQNMAD